MDFFDLYITELAAFGEQFTEVMSPLVILALFFGTAFGLIIGILPGLSVTMAMTLLLTFVFRIPFEIGWALLISVYVGGIFAGGITAIMINIPGTPGAIATCVDGFPLARKGKSRETVGLVTLSSGTGEIIATLVMFILIPIAATLALLLGDWELALVCLIGIILAGAIAGDNPIKGWMAGIMGLVIAMVGLEPIYAHPRFAYVPELYYGIDFIPVLLGIFGLSEVFLVLKEKVPYSLPGKPEKAIFMWNEFKRKKKDVVRSALIGMGVGIIPGTGESVAPWVSYTFAQRSSQNPEDFGKGSNEGVLAAEVANNATSGGALIPTLVLGIPGSGPTAIMLAALLIYGFRPGPMLIIDTPGILSMTVVYFFLAALFMIFVTFLFSKQLISVLSLKRDLLMPIIVVFCVLGAWAANYTLFDISVALAFGVIGCILRLRGFTLAPLVLGVLIGGLFDQYLRRALLTYDANIFALLSRPIGLFLIAFMIFLLYSSFKMKKVAKEKEKEKLSEEVCDTID